MNKQTEGRTDNGAVPVTKSTPDAPDKKADKAHQQSTERAGPDGPDATEVGNTFKKK